MNRLLQIGLGFLVALASIEPAAAACLGDCSGDGSVTVDEIVIGVNIALGVAAPGGCSALDGNSDGQVTVDEIVTSVSNALTGCAAAAPTATASATATQGTAEPTPTAAPRPTLPPGCTVSSGYTRIGLSGASGTNTYTTIGAPIDLFGVTGANLPSQNGVSTTSVICPTSLDSPVITLSAGVVGYPQAMAAGNVYELHAAPIFQPPYFLITTVVYTERMATDPLNARGWVAESGTLRIDSFDASSVTMTIDAQMIPQSSTVATGTFRMQATVTVDRFV